ncbi:hypothetical protein U1Q18_037231, partial [Sarracenia purpurea var. burkii]
MGEPERALPKPSSDVGQTSFRQRERYEGNRGAPWLIVFPHHIHPSSPVDPPPSLPLVSLP